MNILANNLSKVYSEGNLALDGVTFDLEHRGIFSLIGQNGAGKTTLVRILSTQLMPTSGTAAIDELDVVRDAVKIRERIAAVPQEARAVPWMTPSQTVTAYLMWRGYSHSDSRQMARDAIRKFGMEGFEDVKNRKLSGGQKRKVLVSSVLSCEADLIFLDEPTTGLDYISRKELWNILASLRHDRSIVLTTHYLEEAEVLGDHIGVLKDGRMVGFGTLQELRKITKYPLGIRIFDGSYDVSSVRGKAVMMDGSVQVFTTEDEVFSIVNDLITKRIMFTVQETSLNTIFETLVYGGGVDVQA